MSNHKPVAHLQVEPSISAGIFRPITQGVAQTVRTASAKVQTKDSSTAVPRMVSGRRPVLVDISRNSTLTGAVSSAVSGTSVNMASTGRRNRNRPSGLFR